MTTFQPAASIASTHATPTSVWKWLLNVSGNSTTGRPCGLAVPPRSRNHRCSVIGAKRGSGRLRSMPAASFASRARPGVCVAKFAISGIRDASRAAWSMNPNAYAYRGRHRRTDL
ncbi:Uncharacterised protein [Mycobacterium tuberculosis]|nr:Uncharacterised protein [Mycobacterium tuberculosis]